MALVTVVALIVPATSSAATPISTTGPFLITNAHSHMCADVPYGSPTNGTQVQLWDCWGGDMQKWYLDFVAYDGTAYFAIRNKMTNKCLDIPWGDPTWGKQVQEWDCWGDQNNGQMQEWQEVQLGNNLVQYKNRMTGLCLDDPNGSLALGTILQQWPCAGTATPGGDSMSWRDYQV